MPFLLTDPSPAPGLIFALRFDAAGEGRRIPSDAELTDLAVPEGFVWLHLDLIDARVEGLIAQGRLGPADLAATTFGRDDHQRVVVEEPCIGLVLCDHAREFDGTVGPAPTGRLHALIGPSYLVTGRRHATAGAEAAREAVLAGRRVPSPAKLLELCLSGVITATHAATIRFSDAIDAIEDRVLDESVRCDAAPLGPIRRQAVQLHRQISGLAAVFHRLEAETEAHEDEHPDSVSAMAARVVQRLDALHRDMHLLSERSRLLQDEIAGRSAAETNRQLFTLSILTALFLPPTLVTGVFGMNTKGLFLGDFENGSLIALGIGALAALAVYLIIRRLGVVQPRG